MIIPIAIAKGFYLPRGDPLSKEPFSRAHHGSDLTVGDLPRYRSAMTIEKKVMGNNVIAR